MTLIELITELQNIADRFGDCDVQIANNNDNILDTWVQTVFVSLKIENFKQ